MRFKLQHVEKWVFGINLQIERCGCKHLDFCFLDLVLRCDFGWCKNLDEL